MRHPRSQQAGADQDVEERGGPEILEQDGEKEGRRHRADFGKRRGKPRAHPRTFVGKTSPASRYVIAFGPMLVMKLKSMNPAKISATCIVPSK